MKKVWIILVSGLLAFLIIGADLRGSEISEKVASKKCHGYTVIEASKGVDCYGDTIKLAKVNGYFQRIIE